MRLGGNEHNLSRPQKQVGGDLAAKRIPLLSAAAAGQSEILFLARLGSEPCDARS
jgi:hypothetical protein